MLIKFKISINSRVNPRLFIMAVVIFVIWSPSQVFSNSLRIINRDNTDEHQFDGLQLCENGSRIIDTKVGESTKQKFESVKIDKKLATKKYQIAGMLYFNGNVDGAIKKYEEALSYNPDMWQVHLQLAQLYIKSGHPNKASIQCQELIKTKHNEKEAYLMIASIERGRHNLQEAINAYDNAIKYGANKGQLYNIIALMYLQKADFDHALEYSKLASTEQPKSNTAKLTLAAIYFKKGDAKKALLIIDEAILQNKIFPDGHNLKGDIYFAQEKYTDALNEYQEAIKQNPKYVQAYCSEGNVYFKLGQSSKAVTAFEHACTLNPQDKNTMYSYAVALEKNNNDDKAIDEFQKALLLETNSSMAAQIRNHIAQLRQKNSYTVGARLPKISPEKQKEIDDIINSTTLKKPCYDDIQTIMKNKPRAGLLTSP